MQLSTPRAHLTSMRGSRSRIKPAFAAADPRSPSSLNSSSATSPPPQQPRALLLRSPPAPPPGWDAQVARIDSKPLSKLVLALFRSKMALALDGRDRARNVDARDLAWDGLWTVVSFSLPEDAGSAGQVGSHGTAGAGARPEQQRF